MCGRYTLRTPANQLVLAFALADVPAIQPRYNIAPTQDVLAVRLNDRRQREAASLRWGLIPSWADDPNIGSRMVNARAESIAEKPPFRSSFLRSRCLILADGFYEWKKQGAAKQPYFIRLKTDRPFAFAGLAEHWQRDEQRIDSCTIITTAANELMASLHDRMPVIVSPADYDLWLDPQVQDRGKLLPLLRPYPPDEMVAYPVSTTVNSPRNDRPECIEPSDGDRGQSQGFLFS